LNALGEKLMPRLLGKQSSNGGYAALFLLLAIAAIGSLEYLGVVDIIPGFGRDSGFNNQSELQRRHS
jgi:hypothetical protein